MNTIRILKTDMEEFYLVIVTHFNRSAFGWLNFELSELLLIEDSNINPTG